jgi:integrase
MSRRHYLNTAGSFYRWAIAKRFAFSTPLDPLAVTRPRIRRGSIRFFDVDQCKTLLTVFSKHGLRSYTVLGLFCGIRPEETRRLRRQNFKIDGDRIVITLDSDVTKTVWRRVIELQRKTPLGDAVWAWLGGNGELNLPERIGPSLATWRRRFRKVRKELGFAWVMRHTAATYHYALSRDEQATSALLGHTSPAMLRTHYKGLTTEAEAKRFYGLRPIEGQGNE